MKVRNLKFISCRSSTLIKKIKLKLNKNKVVVAGSKIQCKSIPCSPPSFEILSNQILYFNFEHDSPHSFNLQSYPLHRTRVHHAASIGSSIKTFKWLKGSKVTQIENARAYMPKVKENGMIIDRIYPGNHIKPVKQAGPGQVRSLNKPDTTHSDHITCLCLCLLHSHNLAYLSLRSK